MSEPTPPATSTPLKSRISIFGAILRKSIVVQNQNNDDTERTVLRVEIEEKDKLEKSMNENALVVATTNGGIPVANLETHFDTCLKMFTTNKITAKNAWQLNILDYMSKLVNSNGEVSNMLQVAGTSLDIGTKIYSIRVDDIYDEVLKLANSLTRVQIREIKDGEESEDDSDTEGAAAAAPNKRKTKLKRKLDCSTEVRATVCIHEDALNAPLKKNKNLMDNCEDGNTTLQLLNVTFKKKPGFSFELLTKTQSKNYTWASANHTVGYDDGLNYPTDEIIVLPELPICTIFKDFAIDDTDPDELDTSDEEDDDQKFDANGIPEIYIDPELSTPEAESIKIKNDEDADCPVSLESVFITDMKPVGSQQNKLEYTYRPVPMLSEKFDLTGVWAGPSHWKLKCLRKSEEILATKNEKKKQTTRQTKAKCKPFDFENVSLEDMRSALESISKKKKRTCKVTQATNFEACTLPEYSGVNNEIGVRLMNRPMVVIYKAAESRQDSLDVTEYEFENMNDNEYCSAVVGNDWDTESQDDGKKPDDNEDTDDDELPEGFEVQSYPNDESLIEAPNMVQQQTVPYAHTAKKIDMKKLKSVMWEELNKNGIKEEVVAVSEGDPAPQASLQQLCRDLPGRLPASMSESISPALAFVALLHLANEQNLTLESQGLSEVIIKKQ